MKQKELKILLADDDKDDCLLFREALAELQIPVNLSWVYNGEELMQLLTSFVDLPDILFLDLNMPRKNGFDCLIEIKQNEKLMHLPVITISTSFEQAFINLLYQNGAQHYIRKPNEFIQLKLLIKKAIALSTSQNFSKPAKENFVLIEELIT